MLLWLTALLTLAAPLAREPPEHAWTMTSELCAEPDGAGSYFLLFDGKQAHLRGWGDCTGYGHSLDYTFDMDRGPRAMYTFESEFARLVLDAEGRLVSFEELNDLFGTWVRFEPAA